VYALPAHSDRRWRVRPPLRHELPDRHEGCVKQRLTQRVRGRKGGEKYSRRTLARRAASWLRGLNTEAVNPCGTRSFLLFSAMKSNRVVHYGYGLRYLRRASVRMSNSQYQQEITVPGASARYFRDFKSAGAAADQRRPSRVRTRPSRMRGDLYYKAKEKKRTRSY